MLKSKEKPKAQTNRRPDSPRPQTPLDHFRTDIPRIDSVPEIEYFNTRELREIEASLTKQQAARRNERLTSASSNSSPKPASYSVDDLLRIFMFSSISPSNTPSYPPVNDVDDESVGLGID